jgi:tetratricopeptide (TPR) repeat protein
MEVPGVLIFVKKSLDVAWREISMLPAFLRGLCLVATLGALSGCYSSRNDLLQLGDTARSRGNLKGAVAFYTQALEHSSQRASVRASAWQKRGETYFQAGEYGQAAADFTRILEEDPKNPVVLMHRGSANLKLGRFSDAIQDFTTALESGPPDPALYRRRGRAHAAQLNFTAALADAESAIQLDPNNADGYVQQGEAYLRLGKLEFAERDLSKAIQRNPDSAYAHWYRAEAREQLGNLAGAGVDRKRALELDPSLEFATSNVGASLLGDLTGRRDPATRTSPLDLSTLNGN